MLPPLRSHSSTVCKYVSKFPSHPPACTPPAGCKRWDSVVREEDEEEKRGKVGRRVARAFRGVPFHHVGEL